MKERHPQRRDLRKGFSFLEVMFAVMILAVLSAVVVPYYTNSKVDSETKACLSNVRALVVAEEMYKLDNGSYTTTAGNLINEGIAQVPTCPTDGRAYTLSLNNGTLTITCAGAHPANTVTQH